MKRNLRLRGTVVPATGASSGIGKASARRFAERGADLVLAARDREAGARTIAVPTDVADGAARWRHRPKRPEASAGMAAAGTAVALGTRVVPCGRRDSMRR